MKNTCIYAKKFSHYKENNDHLQQEKNKLVKLIETVFLLYTHSYPPNAQTLYVHGMHNYICINITHTDTNVQVYTCMGMNIQAKIYII